MGDSTENTNELDSYGVWVKRPPQDSNEDTIIPETAASEEDTVFDDDFPGFGEIPSDDSASKVQSGILDSTEEADDVSLDDFEGLDFGKDPREEESTSEDEMSLDDFLGADEGSGSEEVSLDDFLDEGSSEELSLDDFLDEGSSSKSQKEDDVAGDEALDIDLDFDPPEDKVVQTEEAPDENEETYEDFADEEPAEEIIVEDKTETASIDVGLMEDVSLDDFSLDESDASTADATAAAVTSAMENADASEFSSEGGTKSPSSAKETVVDYDLAITEDDEVSSAPAIKEIKTEAKATDKENSTENTEIRNELLEQIISDLSGLKNEISSLKSDLAELKDSGSFPKEQPCQSDADESVMPEIADEEPSGFFSGTDEDETIALSGDELSNIMNSADFTEEIVEGPSSPSLDENDFAAENFGTAEKDGESEAEPEYALEEDGISIGETELSEEPSETYEENPVGTEDASLSDFGIEDEPLENTPGEEPSFDDAAETVLEEDETAGIPETLPDDIIDEPVLEEEPSSSINDFSADFTDDTPFGAVDSEIPEMAEESDSGLSMEIEEENLEEPDLESIGEELPEEIDIPKVDDLVSYEDSQADAESIVVEPSDDFMVAEADLDENSVENSEDDISEPDEALDIQIDDGGNESEPSLEEFEAEENSEGEIADPFGDLMEEPVSVEDAITDENIGYLSEDENAIPTETYEDSSTREKGDLPEDIRSDVKSVLLYMDQLLENLPEEKIMEFAKSEQFATYKKLFSELGLS